MSIKFVLDSAVAGRLLESLVRKRNANSHLWRPAGIDARLKDAFVFWPTPKSDDELLDTFRQEASAYFATDERYHQLVEFAKRLLFFLRATECSSQFCFVDSFSARGAVAGSIQELWNNYLSEIAAFQELLKWEEQVAEDLLRQMQSVVEKLALKILRRTFGGKKHGKKPIAENSVFGFSLAKEKMWPLLMAFKNN